MKSSPKIAALHMVCLEFGDHKECFVPVNKCSVSGDLVVRMFSVHGSHRSFKLLEFFL